MSKGTVGINFVITEEAGGFKRLVMDAEGLRRVMQENVKVSQQMQNKYFKGAAQTATYQNVARAAEALNGVMRDMSDAYSVQKEAETKLETVMRQRMNASDETIQSIKDLAGEQQKLGVIGDEVQLAGAQQIATFLTQKQSLEALIPAMNNLLAQQKGLNATGADAVNIGNLMGKAMQGNVGALKRVGITFNDAQAQVMKYGSESERAAMLAEIITQNVGQMNAELAKTGAGKLKQTENWLGDLKEQLGAIAQKGMVYMTMVTTLTRFGTSVATITNAFKAFNIVQTAAAAKQGLLRTLLLLGTGSKLKAAEALNTYNIAAKKSAASTRAMGLAVRGFLVATGIGVAIAAITVLIEHLINATDKATDATDRFLDAEERARQEAEKLREAEERINQTRTDTLSKIEEHKTKLKTLVEQHKEDKKIVAELNDTYGETMGYFSTVADWYKALTANSKTYCDQMVREARIRQLANRIASKETKRRSIIYDKNGNKRKYSDHHEKEIKYDEDGYYDPTELSTRRVKSITVYPSELDEAQNNLDELEKEIRADKKLMRELVEAQSKVSYAVTGSKTKPGTVTPPVRTAVPKRSTEKTEDHTLKLIEEAKTLEEIENNIAYYRAELQKASDVEKAADINKSIDEWQKKADAIRNAGKAVSETKKEEQPSKPELLLNEKASTLKEIEDNIRYLEEELQKANEEEAATVNRSIAAWEKKADAIRNAGKEAEKSAGGFREAYGAVKGIGGAVESITGALHDNGSAWQKLTAIVDGFLQIYDGIKVVIDIIDALTGATKIQTAVEAVHTATTVTDTAAVGTNTAALGANTTAALTNTGAKSGEAVANATAEGAKKPFPYNLIAIAAGVAAVVGALAIAGAFANGGIVGGNSPTGDKLLARVNSGEMVLNKNQQSRLFRMINSPMPATQVNTPQPRVIAVALDSHGLHENAAPRGGEGKVSFRIEGRTLVGLLEKMNTLNSRR